MKQVAQTSPNDPPPEQEPTHDVPVYPERDPPPGSESAARNDAAARRTRNGTDPDEGPPKAKPEKRAKPVDHDVDDDDLDPQAPRSPPDTLEADQKGKIIYEESAVY